MQAFFDGLLLVLAWPAIGMLFLGVMIGLYLGAVPGLGGMVGFAMLMPFTFGMDPVVAFALLLGMYAVTTTSDTLTAVLLGVPGTGAAAATVVDGYPMAKRGEAMRALGAAYTGSAIGGVFGALSLALTLPIIKPLILAFAPPEFFMLGVLGLTYVGALSGRSISRGLIAALFGLLIATIGYSTQGGIARYSFEVNYLLDGLAVIPLALGLFAIPEIVELACRGLPIAGDSETKSTKGQMLQGIRDAFTHWWLVLRSSLIGIYIGMLPGIGASIADWVAYGHAVHTAKDKSQFGHGDVRGVIAPETANNSVKGSDLVPTIAFGIPGSAAMSILLGAFLIHGLRPGPEMLTTKLTFTYSLVWTLVIANLAGALALMLWSRQIAKIVFLRANLIVPAIILFSFMGAWMNKSQLGDWITLLVFGVIGIWFKHAGWPRPPVILGFVLGPIMEANLDISLQAVGWGFVTRPLVIAMIVILAVSFAFELRRQRQMQKSGGAVPVADLAEGGSAKDLSAGKSAAPSPVSNIVLAAMFIVLFVMALWFSRDWAWDAAMFPKVIGVLGIGVAALVLVTSIRSLAHTAEPAKDETMSAARIAQMLLFLTGIIVLTKLFGQLIAMPVMVGVYLAWWGRENWKIVIGQALAAWAILYFMFGELMKVIWATPLWEMF
ncbi:MAG: tripartite tricarboxylate transporter permease [Beijerinckiaceae bacterium]|jgi:putative tricarboxylic transport membrane protein|nr:tripartite tricarboxylate transporter permease [Beijerinckiaceae bacterium]